MEETIYISPDDVKIIDTEDYSCEVVEHFSDIPEMAKPLLKGAKKTFKVIQEYLLKDREKENGYGKYFKEK